MFPSNSSHSIQLCVLDCINNQYSHISLTYSGCKVCLRLYLNGDGTGKGTHISLFIDCDRPRRQSFKRKILLTLIGKCMCIVILSLWKAKVDKIVCKEARNIDQATTLL